MTNNQSNMDDTLLKTQDYNTKDSLDENSNTSSLIDILIKDPRWQKISFHTVESLIKQGFDAVLETIRPKSEKKFALSVLLTNDQEIQTLNHHYRKQNKPTNVLSFESGFDVMTPSTPIIPLGDLVFSFDRIDCEAQEQNKSFVYHFMHLCIHGLLHLFGFNHIQDDDAEIMENLEIHILATKFKIPNPYV